MSYNNINNPRARDVQMSFGGGDVYEHPSPQTIIVRQKDAVIPFSIPLMNQYYFNMAMKNQDYAKFKVSYYDFPLADSLSGIIGSDTILLQMDVQSLYDVPGPGSTPYVKISTFELRLDVRGPLNLESIAASVNNALQEQLLFTRLRLFPDNITYKMCTQFFSYLQSFVYNSDTGRFAFVLQPPVGEPELLVSPENPTFYLQSYRITLANVSPLTQPAINALCAIFGGVQDSATTFNVEFYIKNQELPVSAQLLYLMGRKSNGGDTDALKMHQGYDVLYLESVHDRLPRLHHDPYVYIKGSPEAAIWNNTGTKDSAVAILPRNRGYGSAQMFGAGFVMDAIPWIKTPLSSIRNMTLTLTDRDGVPLIFDEEFTLFITISFEI